MASTARSLLGFAIMENRKGRCLIKRTDILSSQHCWKSDSARRNTHATKSRGI